MLTKNFFVGVIAATLFVATPLIAQNFPSTANPKIVATAVPSTSFSPNMGLAFLSDGRMLFLGAATGTSPGNGAMGQGYITPADGNNALYLVSGLSATGNLSEVTVTKILDQLTGPPPGVVVVNDTVYVQDRTAFYRVNSLSPTGGTSKAANATRIVDVPTLDDSTYTWVRGVSGHQYVFTPQYHNGRFYAAYSASIIPGGFSGTPPTSTYSGALLSWGKDIVPTGVPNAGLTRESGGLRSPNGMATNGVYMLYADNQGSFNPGNPIHIFKPGQPQVTYGTRQGTPANAGGAPSNQIANNSARNWAEDLPYQPPVIWIPFSPFASTSQPLYLDHGPYKGHWILGDVNRAGMGRLFVDDVDSSGRHQASFHMLTGSGINAVGSTQGKAINRMAMSPDSAVYIGTVLNIGNWPSGPPGPVLRMTFRDTAVFEILAVRSRKSADGSQNGVEVFFSQPVNPVTVNAGSFALLQYNYQLAGMYGCNTTVCTQRTPQVAGVTLSDDNRKVFVAVNTPDTSIGAAHIGTLGVGGNPLGVWGGPGKQDRTLRVTISGITSATGASPLHNVAWMGWHFQADTRFDPADTNTTLVPSSIERKPSAAGRLASSITVRAVPGALDVNLALPGSATVSLYSVNGALKKQVTGSTGSFNIDTRSLGRGVHVLKVRQGAAVHSKTLML